MKLALADGYGPEAERRFRQWLQDDGRIAPEHRAVYEAVAPAMADPELRSSAGSMVAEAIEAWPEREWSQLYLMLGLHDDGDSRGAAQQTGCRADPVADGLVGRGSPFREHPRFAELAQRDGLLEFWERFGDPDYCRRVGVAPQRLECER